MVESAAGQPDKPAVIGRNQRDSAELREESNGFEEHAGEQVGVDRIRHLLTQERQHPQTIEYANSK